MRVRAAQPADAPALALLLAALGSPVEPEALARRLERAAGVLDVLVAVEDGAPGGLAALQIVAGLQRDAPSARITAFVVREDLRRRGVARALMAAVEERARAAGCDRIQVVAADHRHDAHAAYEGLGFAPTGRRFVKRLDEEGANVEQPPA